MEGVGLRVKNEGKTDRLSDRQSDQIPNTSEAEIFESVKKSLHTLTKSPQKY